MKERKLSEKSKELKERARKQASSYIVGTENFLFSETELNDYCDQLCEDCKNWMFKHHTGIPFK